MLQGGTHGRSATTFEYASGLGLATVRLASCAALVLPSHFCVDLSATSHAADDGGGTDPPTPGGSVVNGTPEAIVVSGPGGVLHQIIHTGRGAIRHLDVSLLRHEGRSGGTQLEPDIGRGPIVPKAGSGRRPALLGRRQQPRPLGHLRVRPGRPRPRHRRSGPGRGQRRAPAAAAPTRHRPQPADRRPPTRRRPDLAVGRRPVAAACGHRPPSAASPRPSPPRRRRSPGPSTTAPR